MALLQVNFKSNSLMRTVTINAVIPIDKMQLSGMNGSERKTYKTLYLLHGMFGNYSDWVNGTRIQSWAEEKNLAVIMPSGDNSFYVDQEKNGNMYGEFIGKELVQITRNLFPLSDKREDTFIAGLSMGGYGAVRNGLKYHQTFSYIAGLSSALSLDNAVNSKENSALPFHRRSFYESVFGNLNELRGSDKDCKALITKLKKEHADIPKIYLSCGTEDLLRTANRDYRDFLLKNNVDVTYEEGPGGHEWTFWDTYIRRVLNWLPLD